MMRSMMEGTFTSSRMRCTSSRCPFFMATFTLPLIAMARALRFCSDARMVSSRIMRISIKVKIPITSPITSMRARMILSARLFLIKVTMPASGYLSTHGDLRYPEGRLRIAHRRPLAVFSSCADGESEVRTDHINGHEHLRPVPRERCAAYRFADPPVLYEVAFAHLEHEITVHRVHLASAHLFDEQTPGGRAKDVVRIRRAGRYHGVRHSRDRPVLVGFSPPVARGAHPVLQGGQPVIHECFEGPPVNKDGAPGIGALIVKAEGPAPAGKRGVVKHGNKGRRDLLSDLSGIDGKPGLGQVRFQAVAHGLVDHGTAGL